MLWSSAKSVGKDECVRVRSEGTDYGNGVWGQVNVIVKKEVEVHGLTKVWGMEEACEDVGRYVEVVAGVGEAVEGQAGVLG